MSFFELKSRDLTLKIVKGDICTQECDAIVNAANEQLQHGGGIAGAIARASKGRYPEDIDTDSANYNQVKTGTSVVTHSYALPCKMVIHTVGPMYDEGSHDICCDQLKQAVKSILQVIDDFNLQTICVPAISTGIYGFPLPQCAEIFTEELY